MKHHKYHNKISNGSDGNHCTGGKKNNLRFIATYYDVEKYIRECIMSFVYHKCMSVYS